MFLTITFKLIKVKYVNLLNILYILIIILKRVRCLILNIELTNWLRGLARLPCLCCYSNLQRDYSDSTTGKSRRSYLIDPSAWFSGLCRRLADSSRRRAVKFRQSNSKHVAPIQNSSANVCVTSLCDFKLCVYLCDTLE